MVRQRVAGDISNSYFEVIHTSTMYFYEGVGWC